MTDDYDDGADWWQMVSQDQLDAMNRVFEVDDFKAALLPALLKTSGGDPRVPAQLDDDEDQGDELRGPRPDASQGQSRPIAGGGEPAHDLAAALQQALGRPF